MLTTQDFFILQDTLYENTSFYNAETLATNYYLHHWEIVSVPVRTGYPVHGWRLRNDHPDGETGRDEHRAYWCFHRRGRYPGAAIRKPDGHHVARWLMWPSSLTRRCSEVSAVTAKSDNETAGSPIDIDPMKTYVDKFAVLHIAEDMPTGAVVTVTATSAYINPSAATASTRRAMR